MKLNDQKLDELFRDRLRSLEVQPPPTVFEGIAQKMEAPKIKRGAILIRVIAVAAVLVMAFIAGWFYFNDSKVPIEQVSENKQDVRQEKTGEPEKSVQETVSSEASDSNKPIREIKTRDILKLAELPERNKITENATVIPAVKSEDEPVFKILSYYDVFFKEFQIVEVLRIKDEKSWNASEISSVEKNLIAMNSKNMLSSQDKFKSWDIGFRISPGYSSQNASHSESYRQSMTDSNIGGSADLNGGISVGFKAGKRLKLESGVFYSQNGQSSGNNPFLFSSKTDQTFYAGIAESFNTPVKLDRGKMNMNSSAGVIAFSKTPNNVDLLASLDSKNNFTSTILTVGEFSQVFDFIEIPLIVRYNLLDEVVGIDFLGGFSANWLVGNNAYMKTGGVRENIGRTEGISELSYSATLGLGLGYKLGKRISISMEPRFNYYINSINKSSDVDYHPYRLGLYTGLNYRF